MEAKLKKINRKELVSFIRSLTGTNEVKEINKLFFFSKEKNIEDYQMEFIPQTKKYFFTIYIRGISEKGFSKGNHVKTLSYLRGLKLKRNIVLDTDYIVSVV